MLPFLCLVMGYSVLPWAMFLGWSQNESFAQVTTAITPDGSLGTNMQVNGTQHDITGGTRPDDGPNLFHSFGQFSVGSGNTANFLNDSGLPTNNILSRVTGGDPSQIYGTIQTTDFGQASLYLMNPAGVIFGPTASLDIGGSFHVTTADYLQFGEQEVFQADLAKDSVLSIASPGAFGFLNENPVGITISKSTLEVPLKATNSFVGGDISISGGTVGAASGTVNLISVDGPGDIHLVPKELNSPKTVQHFGNVMLSNNTSVTASGDLSGSVIIRGGRLTVDNSGIFASLMGPLVNEPLAIEAGKGVDIQVTDRVLIDNEAQIITNVFQNVTEGIGAGGVRVRATNFELGVDSVIQSSVLLDSTGDKSGDIRVEADKILIRDDGFIQTATGGFANGGNLTLNSQDVELRDGGGVFANVFGGTGNGGTIVIKSPKVSLQNGGYIQTFTTAGPGNAGNIAVDANKVSLFNTDPGGPFTPISSSTGSEATGTAGNVEVTAETLDMFGDGFVQIFSITRGAGKAGNVDLNIRENVAISGGENARSFDTGIFTNTFGTGMGGHLSVTAKNIIMNRASLQASTFGQNGGPSGGATLTLNNNLELHDASFISTNAFFGTGDAADLTISAKNVILNGIGDSVNYFSTDFTGLTVRTRNGKGGNLFLTADTVQILDNAQIDASTHGSGAGGQIKLNLRGDLNLLNGGEILSIATGTGDGGDIMIKAHDITLSGVNIIDPDILDPNDEPSLNATTIATQTQSLEPNAGNIFIEGHNIQVLEGASIKSRTLGAGRAGNIEIVANSLVISGENAEAGDLIGNPFAGHSTVTASTESFHLGEQANGHAGDIRITAQQVEVTEKGELQSSSKGKGDGGKVGITTNRLFVRNDGRIRTVAEPSSHPNVLKDVGDAGNISIFARELFQADDGIVSVATNGNDSNAGSLTIRSGEVQLSNDSGVLAGNVGGGDSGSLIIAVEDTFSSNKSRVLATAEQGTGGDLTILAGQDISLTNDSSVSAETSGSGNAGTVTLEAGNSILIEDSVVNTVAEQADGGNIKLQAPDLIHLIDSRITSSVGGGAATVGGNISLDPEFIILHNSQILANAFGGQGGNITLEADVAILRDPFSLINASSALGINGSVNIQAPIQNLSGTIAPLKHTPTNISTLYGSRCVATQDGLFSSFVERPVAGGLPAPPGSFLASPLFFTLDSGPSSTNTRPKIQTFSAKDETETKQWLNFDKAHQLLMMPGQACSS